MRKIWLLLLIPFGLLMVGLAPPPPLHPMPAPPVYETPVAPTPTAEATPAGAVGLQQNEITPWHGRYFNNRHLSGAPSGERTDPCLDFRWSTASPWSGVVGFDNFSVQWTKRQFFEGGQYRFYLRSDDGSRLWIDPDVNDFTIINAWTDQPPTTYVSDPVPLQTGYNTLRVDYYDRTDNAQVRLWWEKLGTYDGWKAEYYKYFDDPRFCEGPALTRSEGAINHDWGEGTPSSALGNDFWAARWTGSPHFVGGLTRFYALSDDGVRLWVDANDDGVFDEPAERVVDVWVDRAAAISTGDVYLSPGPHRVKVEYYERTGDATMRLWWRTW